VAVADVEGVLGFVDVFYVGVGGGDDEGMLETLKSQNQREERHQVLVTQRKMLGDGGLNIPSIMDFLLVPHQGEYFAGEAVMQQLQHPLCAAVLVEVVVEDDGFHDIN